MNLRSDSKRCTRGGFTIVEVITVVALITLLISMLMPALGKVKENGIRTKCSSRLRQMHIASVSYADEHEGLFPFRTPTTYMPHLIQASTFNLNKSFINPYLRIRDPEVFCPGPLYTVRNPRVFGGYQDVYITYQYHNYNGGGWMVPKPDLLRNTNSGPYALWSCLTVLKDSGNWLAHDRPEVVTEPTGQNAALLDGSVRWYDWGKLEMYALVSSHRFYWPRP